MDVSWLPLFIISSFAAVFIVIFGLLMVIKTTLSLVVQLDPQMRKNQRRVHRVNDPKLDSIKLIKETVFTKQQPQEVPVKSENLVPKSPSFDIKMNKSIIREESKSEGRTSDEIFSDSIFSEDNSFDSQVSDENDSSGGEIKIVVTNPKLPFISIPCKGINKKLVEDDYDD